MLYSVLFFENLPTYEVMFKHMVQEARLQITICCGAEKMRFAYWITETKIHTLIIINIYCFRIDQLCLIS